MRLYIFCALLSFAHLAFFAQGGGSSSPAPYCNGNYTSGNCLQGGPTNTQGNSVNDFIDIFKTGGGTTNINNSNSGCNGNPNNYANYCSHYLQVTPGQVITATVQSGIIFSQGFAIWVDWNQDNTFQNPGEQVAATSNVPPAATPTVLTFTVPATVANGTYRMRVRCAFATPGTNITPCGTFGFGETEDYTIYVGPIPPSGGIPTGTAMVSQSVVCVGQPLTFSVNTAYLGALSYTWTGPASYSSTLLSPTIPSAAINSAGIYTVVISNTSCPISRTVQANVIAYPVISTNPSNHVICQGATFIGNVNVPGSNLQYSYQWMGQGNIASPNGQSTPITPPLQPAAVTQTTLIYSVLVTPTVFGCTSQATLAVQINNPMTPTLNLPGPMCNNANGVQLFASPGGGTWTAPAGLTANGFLTPSLTAASGPFAVQYSVSVGLCIATNTGTVDVSRYHPATLTSGILSRCVQDPPFRLMNIVQDTTGTGSWSGVNVSNNYFTSTNLGTSNYTLTFYNPSLPTNVCPSTTNIVVPVFNPPTPTIVPINPVCNNGATVQLTASPLNGTFTGNSGISFTGLMTPSSCPIGTSQVNYSSGQGTCVATTSRSMEVSRFNPATVSAPLPPFCANGSPFNLNSIVQYTGGIWNGTSVNNNAFSPAGLPTNTYALTYHTLSSPNFTLCPDSARILANVLNPATPVIQLINPLCQKSAAVQLTVSPAGGQWLNAPYLTATGVFVPSLAAVGNNFIQYSIGTSTCKAQSSIFINVEAFVSAQVSGIVQDLCDNAPMISLAPLSSAIGNWTGTGVSGGNFNPAVAGAGSWKIVHHTASAPSGLCPDADTLSIRVFSLAPPVISSIGPFCNNSQPVQLQVSPLGGIFDGANNKAISNDGIFSPYIGVIGKNVVSYSIASGPCIAYTQATITVEKFVSAALDRQPPAAMCVNGEPIDMNSFVRNIGGTWAGPGIINGSSIFNPLNANPGPNNVLRYFTYAANNPLLCPDESTVQIKVKNMPVATVQTTSLSGCSPLQVAFSSLENKTGKGLWTFDDGQTQEGFSASHVYTRNGQYKVVYNYEDTEAKGCTVQVKLTQPVKVLSQPKADFDLSSDEIFITDPQVQLINKTDVIGDNTYVWTIFGMQQYTGVNPTITFPQAGTYRILLTATNANGCKSEIMKMAEVKNDFNVFVPNSFTPNYDGKNDVFKPVFSPYGLDFSSYYMRIFNRWGQLVFETKDHSEGWDGSLRNFADGLPKSDSYNYEIRYSDIEGHMYTKTGTVFILP